MYDLMPDNQVMKIDPDALKALEAPELRKLALEALLEPNSGKKLALAQWIRAQAATIFIATDAELEAPTGVPGNPPRPELRSHLDVPKRSPFTIEGLAEIGRAVV